MGCIEMLVPDRDAGKVSRINRNMGCIEIRDGTADRDTELD